MKAKIQPTWGGRFRSSPADVVQQFTESVSFDWRLYRQDIAGSIAHARGLARAGILSAKEAKQIERRLRAIERRIAAGRFSWDPALEDVHMNIEAALGSLGRKLHAGRSRNDQVVTDLCLWCREAVGHTVMAVQQLMRALLQLAENNSDVVMPGYTHLQRAQPVLLAHHLLAYVEMLERDTQRFIAALPVECPLGSGALAGTTLPLDREYVARRLGFTAVTRNSMDAVSSRDFVLDYLYAAAVTGMHLSRLAEDLILWCTAEFGFVTIADAYATGSSLMPQKKNPDVCELVRGKAGRLFGNLLTMLAVLKGLPLTYNRDLQEDKEPLFDSARTILSCLHVLAELVPQLQVNKARCEAAARDPLLLATDLVDFLVKRGMPFRQAHHTVGTLVAEAERKGVGLPELATRKFGPDAAQIFDVRRALSARKVTGAPSLQNVRTQIARWKKLLR